MVRPIKPILFAVIILAATVSVAYALNLIDSIVHGQLYSYELKFDLAWANPYWNLLRIIQVLLGVIVVSTVLNLIFTVKKSVSVKKPSEETALNQKLAKIVPPKTHKVEKEIVHQPSRVSPLLTVPPAPASPQEPVQPAPFPSDISGLTRCLHCGRLFSQPLRMLDFQGDRPRIVSICPFCNEIITTTTTSRRE